MSSIEVECPQTQLQTSSTALELSEVEVTVSQNFDSDASHLTLSDITEQLYQNIDMNSFIQEHVDTPTIDPSCTDDFENTSNASIVQEEVRIEFKPEQVTFTDDQVDQATVSAQEEVLQIEEQETEQSVEQRLIDKIAEFEGKAEALQSLKSSLYSAIEQLHNETVTINSSEVESHSCISTSIEEEESGSSATEDQVEQEPASETIQEELQEQNFQFADDKQSLIDQITEEVCNLQEDLVQQEETPAKDKHEEEGPVDQSISDILSMPQIDFSQEDDEEEGLGLLQLSQIQCNQDLDVQNIQAQDQSNDQVESTNSAQQEQLQDTETSLRLRSQPDGDSKLKWILDDFFSQVETEGAQRGQQKKKQYQAGKENAPANLHAPSQQQCQDQTETPKHKVHTEEDVQQSPVKKRHHSQAQPKEELTVQEQQQIEQPSPIEETVTDTLRQHQEERNSQSPKEQQIHAQEDQENQPKEDTRRQDENNSPKEQDSTETSEEKKRKTQLQREKDQLRAPFSELNNGNQKKRSTESLKELEKEGKVKRNRIVDVNKTIFVDSYILNYSTFFPGKLLGSTLNVGNLSNAEQIVELSIDSNSFQYNKKTLNTQFGNPELPFSIAAETTDSDDKKQESIVNSEIKHEAWYIENPISKELTKRITLKLGPKAEQDFIIVVRSPNPKKSENLLSIINIGLLTYADEQFGVKESFEDFLKTNYNSSMKEFLRDRKKVAQQQRLEILLAGRVEVPNLICQKELLVADVNEKVVPLVVKKGQACQKFRIPFKNNGAQDLDIDFTFAKQSAVIQGPLQRQNSTGSDGKERPPMTQSPIEFVSTPSNLKIPANTAGILNIAAKLKNSYQLASISKEAANASNNSRPEIYNHLLIAKIKDTQIMFSFIIEASVLESSGNSSMS